MARECDRIEDEIRNHAITQDIYSEETATVHQDMLSNLRYVKTVKEPIQKKALFIDEQFLPRNNPYCNNLVTIKPWDTKDPRDKCLQTCEAIIEQLAQAPNYVSKSLPLFVGLARSLGGEQM